ncbi:uncharacterized protein LOC111052850 isoform X3 [Nilaparvata lugens]|nr:uncharacterized protein LOC111052850 isoform X3 [Nilaparvata lugens]XP_039276663.1 uncharacterized protein LOC111052850 isoform X4 [Nilaparvata lugens]XP_039276664.1 uncharacterized protein LOC111052850 isoform X3 [Nilaparvata lugens]
MSQFGSGGVKNPPWARQGQQNQSMLGQNTNNSMQQQGGQMQQTPMAGQASLLQYPPQQIFQQNQMQQVISLIFIFRHWSILLNNTSRVEITFAPITFKP